MAHAHALRKHLPRSLSESMFKDVVCSLCQQHNILTAVACEHTFNPSTCHNQACGKQGHVNETLPPVTIKRAASRGIGTRVTYHVGAAQRTRTSAARPDDRLQPSFSTLGARRSCGSTVARPGPPRSAIRSTSHTRSRVATCAALRLLGFQVHGPAAQRHQVHQPHALARRHLRSTLLLRVQDLRIPDPQATSSRALRAALLGGLQLPASLLYAAVQCAPKIRESQSRGQANCNRE